MSSPLDTPLLHRVHNQFVEGRKHHPNIEPRGIDRYMFVNQCGGVAGGRVSSTYSVVQSMPKLSEPTCNLEPELTSFKELPTCGSRGGMLRHGTRHHY